MAAAAVSACSKNEKITFHDYTAPFGRVIEYTPAPGQFINETVGLDTPEKAAAYAAGQLRKGSFVSLGAFGGYIVFAFDEPVANGGGYDFYVTGNPMPTSSEPGIVWVMSDRNGNGLPDDGPWYELKGSDTDSPATIKGYSVTYSRPAPGGDVPWTDSEGGSGTIPRNSAHTQESYYPDWIEEDEYTLTGTRLEPRTYNDGQWVNGAFDWGYADNYGSDRGEGADAAKVRFKISNATDAAGMPVHVASIDFVKVQTGVFAVAGSLGEVSTEVFGFGRITTSE